MSKVLILSDIEGVLKTTPYIQKEFKELLPTDVAQDLGAGWFLVREDANPMTHFVLDSTIKINFHNEVRNVDVPLDLEYSSEVVEVFKSFMENPEVDFRWLSYWNKNVLTLNPIFDLDIPYVEAPNTVLYGGRTNKIDAIQKLYDSDYSLPTNLIWIDLDSNRVSTNESIKLHMDRFHEQYGFDSFLNISPSSHHGISRSDVDAVNRFINQVK